MIGPDQMRVSTTQEVITVQIDRDGSVGTLELDDRCAGHWDRFDILEISLIQDSSQSINVVELG